MTYEDQEQTQPHRLSPAPKDDEETNRYPYANASGAPVPTTPEEAPRPSPTNETLAASLPPATTAHTIQVSTDTEKPSASPTTLSTLPRMEIEDLLALQIVSDPQISPDGELIAFTVLQCDARHNSTSSTIWLVERSAQLAAPRQLTRGDHHDSTPRWSPDGQQLAFLSDRTGVSQLYLLSIHGGEALQISKLPSGITEYSWRPDGQMFLTHSYWKPEDDHVPTHDAQTSPFVYRTLAEHWDGLGHRQGRHLQLWLQPLEGPAIRLTSEPVDLTQSCWSPDGTEIVFCANRRSDPDLSVSQALWILTLATGNLRRLTPEEHLAQVPSWSPDGQTIAYLGSPDQTEAGNMAPWLVAASGQAAPQPAVQEAEKLTCQMWIIDELRTEWLAAPLWYPDSTALLVPVQEHGQQHLYRLDLQQNTALRLTTGNGRYLSPQISRDGQHVTMVRADWFTPGDIWHMELDSKRLRKLTRVNDQLLQKRQLIRPKRITWSGFDHQEIEGWLYLPVVPVGTKVPLILMPHGGPSLAWGDSYVHEFQVLAGRGYAVLAPNPRGSAGYGEAFSRSILNDWGGADWLDLQAGLDAVIATEPIDEQRLGIGGMSYGGYMTNWAISQSHRFKAAVSRNGISSLSTSALLSDQTLWFHLSMPDETLWPQRSALSFVDEIQTPLLLLHGDNDLRCPFSESLQLFVQLRKRKQIVELIRYPQASHLFDWPQFGQPQHRRDRLQRTVGWFERFL
ncbi:S9 family peptidase [Tengunoibacter tsumagoiensis]|uniref:Putative peptidase YuxL n=1 Tax=Tengunoibacter tsumagoiensis TaxID=2014871 RepID=A0A402A1Q5_9CHLR|nr:S9 family peptidase [Tengunoibacter tsumagoiensis]GCE12979.1 putative peptidase YuxL [Tengunoibacter tsumagoiensis]